MIASVVETADPAVPACVPAAVRIGLLGLGTVGGAFARLTRSAAPLLHSRGLAPVVTVALVRDSARPRAAASCVSHVVTDGEAFFNADVDVVVEALGGVQPAHALVARALDRGIPVVTANKSLVAAHGDTLAALARRRGTALRYEASCVAGVPFLGTFERRPLASRCLGVDAILNGTSNAIVSALERGATFSAALQDAQQRGLAEPDPSADISGADAAQKLAILIRLFGARAVDAASIPAVALSAVSEDDVRAAQAFGGRLKPVAVARWTDEHVEAFVGPAFVPSTHPLAAVSHVANGVLLQTHGGPQCFVGPGAGPDVTAATLLDDVVEIATERTVRSPAAVAVRTASVSHPQTRWFLRLPASGADADVCDLLGSFGIWCERVARVGGHRYALMLSAPRERVTAAAAALGTATGSRVLALAALGQEETC